MTFFFFNWRFLDISYLCTFGIRRKPRGSLGGGGHVWVAPHRWQSPPSPEVRGRPMSLRKRFCALGPGEEMYHQISPIHCKYISTFGLILKYMCISYNQGTLYSSRILRLQKVSEFAIPSTQTQYMTKIWQVYNKNILLVKKFSLNSHKNFMCDSPVESVKSGIVSVLGKNISYRINLMIV